MASPVSRKRVYDPSYQDVVPGNKKTNEQSNSGDDSAIAKMGRVKRNLFAENDWDAVPRTAEAQKLTSDFQPLGDRNIKKLPELDSLQRAPLSVIRQN